jgi:uncharacterized protein YodC (DUF2158 family)
LSKNTGISDAFRKKFPKGMKVKLVSGGPTMAVKGYHEFDETMVCQWFSGKKLESGMFAPETLVVVTDDADEKQSS